MKVLVLSDTFPPDAPGGAGKVAYELSRGLHDSGIDLQVVSVSHTHDEAIPSDSPPFPVHRLRSNYPKRFRPYLSLWNPATLPHVRRLMDAFQPDVVHAHNVHADLSYASLGIAARRGIPVMLTAHDTMTFTYGKYDAFIDQQALNIPETFDYRLLPLFNLRHQRLRYFPARNLLIRRVVRRNVDVLAMVSHALNKALQANRIRAKRNVVIYNGIDAARWRPDPGQTKTFMRKQGLEGSKVILFGGRVSPAKGGEALLRALPIVIRRVPNAKLLVLGRADGFARHMMDSAGSIGLMDAIRIAGWLSGPALRAAYSASDVCVTPSLYLDPFPTINLEAMAAGLPIVGTCFGGTPEAVTDGDTGYVVNPYDVDMLADRIARLLEDDRLAERLGEAGRRRVQEHFSLSEMVQKTLTLYAEIAF